MAKHLRRSLLLAVAMAIGGSALSCTGGASAAPPAKKVTYKCLMSSCDATVVCNEGDPVPQHHGKPMIQ